MPLDPQIGRLLHALALSPAGPGEATDLRQRRAAFAGLMRLAGSGARVGDTERRSVPGPQSTISLQLYTPLKPARPTLPGLIFLHGGGFECGDLDTHDALCRTLCEATECRLIAIDYRLAPEHPFPAAVEDAQAAALWVLDQADALQLDRKRIAIAGDSAGATLAAVVCRRVLATRPDAFALQLLLCPILDWAADADARRTFVPGRLLDGATVARQRAAYLPAGQDAEHPDVSPLRAIDLRGQPPAHIHTAEFDPVRDDGRIYADRLRTAGVAVRHTCHAGMTHLFYGLGQVVPSARAALGAIGADVRTALA